MPFAILNATRTKNRAIETYESRRVARDPGDEDDLASAVAAGE